MRGLHKETEFWSFSLYHKKASKMRKKWTDKCESWTDDIDLFQDIKIFA